MAIPARVIAIDLAAARRALRELAATGRRPTRHEIAQRARLAREQTTPELGAPGGPMAADDIRHLQHGVLVVRSAEAVDEMRQWIGEGRPDLLSQVRVDLSCPGTAVAQDLLNDPKVHAHFQQMRRERVAQRVH